LLELLRSTTSTWTHSAVTGSSVHHDWLDDVELPRRVLLTDAAIVLYDGNPGQPDLGALWELAERTSMTCSGTSASYIGSCMKAGIEPARDHDLSALHSVGSTGSPLSPEGFQWVYDHVGADTWLFSTSAAATSAPRSSVACLLCRSIEVSCRRARSARPSSRGTPRVDAGQRGRRARDHEADAFDCQSTSGVDTEGERYRSSYFDMYPGVWRHG